MHIFGSISLEAQYFVSSADLLSSVTYLILWYTTLHGRKIVQPSVKYS